MISVLYAEGSLGSHGPRSLTSSLNWFSAHIGAALTRSLKPEQTSWPSRSNTTVVCKSEKDSSAGELPPGMRGSAVLENGAR